MTCFTNFSTKLRNSTNVFPLIAPVTGVSSTSSSRPVGGFPNGGVGNSIPAELTVVTLRAIPPPACADGAGVASGPRVCSSFEELPAEMATAVAVVANAAPAPTAAAVVPTPLLFSLSLLSNPEEPFASSCCCCCCCFGATVSTLCCQYIAIGAFFTLCCFCSGLSGPSPSHSSSRSSLRPAMSAWTSTSVRLISLFLASAVASA
mmetsp:Transcript_19100/g.40265  ORF Transcript_19100/g.40265 Transcript_19100/m.40265 type:complete len:205 (-) Transcript_19100:314-928(-)